MSYKILIPLDGSELADEIFPYVRGVVARPDAKTILLNVLPNLVGVARTGIERGLHRARTHLERYRDGFYAETNRIHCKIRMGDPAEEILKLAILVGASLIAMPTRRMTAHNRSFLGSVAARVLQRTPCPMLLAPWRADEEYTRPEFRPINRILVPLDGSNVAASIIPLVDEFARACESEVILFHNELPPNPAERRNNSDAKTILEPYRERLMRSKLKVTLDSSSLGQPAKAILKKVKERNINLVAMTTRGRSGVSHSVFGSAAEHVLHHCQCPLLIRSMTPNSIAQTEIGTV